MGIRTEEAKETDEKWKWINKGERPVIENGVETVHEDKLREKMWLKVKDGKVNKDRRDEIGR